MTWEETKDHPALIPTVSSVFLHVVLILLSMWIVMPGSRKLPQQDYIKFNVRGVDTKPFAVKGPGGSQNPKQFVSPLRGATPGEMRPVKPDMPDISMKNLVESKPFSRPSDGPKELEKMQTPVMGTPNLESVLTTTEERQQKENVQPRRVSTSGSREVARMSQAGKADAAGMVTILKQSIQGLGFRSSANLGMDPEEGMPGFTPVGTGAGGAFEGIGNGGGPLESTGSLVKYESLDNFMDVQVFTYKDPTDGLNYFMVKITAKKEAQSFAAMPKEMIFTIDCSLSISPDRLNEFKKGIRYCLTHMNPGDTFNIVAFKDTVQFFAPKSVPPTPENVKNAERFVSELTASSRTDVYAPFTKIVESPLDHVPSNVMLLSDGRPTHGIQDSRELIKSITRLNGKVRPVFAFSGGANVNRYLLDFIAYQNRGWSEFIKRTTDVGRGLGQFYDKIRDPIFVNLRYRLTDLDEKDVYPKSLPDFYRNAEFTLYGTYQEAEDSFSMQLLGDINGKTKELIFERSLKSAPKGNADIMKGYAFNKIYDRISRETSEGSDPARLKEIEELSRHYGVKTPYSKEIEKLD